MKRLSALHALYALIASLISFAFFGLAVNKIPEVMSIWLIFIGILVIIKPLFLFNVILKMRERSKINIELWGNEHQFRSFIKKIGVIGGTILLLIGLHNLLNLIKLTR